jgi:hypothetical protein
MMSIFEAGFVAVEIEQMEPCIGAVRRVGGHDFVQVRDRDATDPAWLQNPITLGNTDPALLGRQMLEHVGGKGRSEGIVSIGKSF